MTKLKGYKGAALIYLVITIVNVFWICNYNRPEKVVNNVQTQRDYVVNYEVNN